MTINIYTELRERFDVNVEIIANPDSTYTLRWDDMVINEWSETFPTLSIALARLAALTHCGERDWETGFSTSDKDFAGYTKAFFETLA